MSARARPGIPHFAATEKPTAFESILVIGARMVGDLEARSPSIRVLEQVDVGPIIEPMMPGPIAIGAVEVMDVAEPAHLLEMASMSRHLDTCKVATFSSPAWTAIAARSMPANFFFSTESPKQPRAI
jgi:hypothetical protein